MKIKKNGKVFRLTESDLKRIVKRVLTEELTFNVNNPEFGVDGQNMERERNTYSYFNPKYNKYYTNNGIYTDHNDEEYSEEWEDYEFDDFTDLKRSDIPNDNWIDLRTRKGFDSMKGEDGKVRIRKNPYLYRRRSGFPDIRIKEQEIITMDTPPDFKVSKPLPDCAKIFEKQAIEDARKRKDLRVGAVTFDIGSVSLKVLTGPVPPGDEGIYLTKDGETEQFCKFKLK
tara:strand:- start:700 stop:1383 length:684 start_codon:yes stop_codon:yes gene_type:complete